MIVALNVIALGSNNPIKRLGLLHALRVVMGFDEEREAPKILLVPDAQDKDVPNQPMSLNQMYQGAATRARQSRLWTGADLGVGFESGVFEVSYTAGSPNAQVVGRRLLDACACVVCDQSGRTEVGLSSGFEVPADVAACMRTNGFEMTKAVEYLGMGQDTGRNGGLIDICTNGLVVRADQIEQAAILALVRW